MKTRPKVGLVIPYYAGEADIEECLRSVFASRYPPARVYLADNSPTRYAAPLDDRLTRLVLPVGIGFGRACNAGIHQALRDANEYVMLLNQDARLAPEAIGKMVEAMVVEEELAAVAPLAYDLAMNEIATKTYQYYVAPVPGLAEDLRHDRLRLFYPVDYNQINGACLCLRAADLRERPWFDPIFHQYGEDTEFFQRVRYQYRRQLGVVPAARLGHRHSNFSSTGARADRIAALVRNGVLITWLKDPRRTWWNALGKALVVGLHTQWLQARAGHARRLPAFWLSDVRLLGKLSEIHRRRSIVYLRTVVEDQIKKDLGEAWA